MTVEVDGTHPTGMHSCFCYFQLLQAVLVKNLLEVGALKFMQKIQMLPPDQLRHQQLVQV